MSAHFSDNPNQKHPLGKHYFYTKRPIIGGANFEYSMFRLDGTLVGKQISCPDEGDARTAEFNAKSQANLRRTTPQMSRSMKGQP